MNTQATSQVGEKLLRVLVFTLIISSLSALLFQIVLKDISKEFHLSVAQVSWLTTAYTIIYALGTIIYGKLSDRWRLRSLLTIGLSIFAFGSLIGVFSQAFWVALLGRCIQSIGASVIPATAMMIPVRYFSVEERGKAIGTISVGLAIGMVLGPIISSLIVSIANWRWLFSLPLLILLTLPFYRAYLKEEPHPKGEKETFDWWGAGLLALTVTMLLLSITEGIGGFLLGSGISLSLLIWRMHQAQNPFLKPILFQNNQYVWGLVIAFLSNCLVASLTFLIPLLLNEVYHLSASWIGLTMVPAALGSALLGRFGGKLADRKGDTTVFYLSTGLLVSAFMLLSTFLDRSPIMIMLFLILGNIGQTFMMVSVTNTISKTLPRDHAGVGMGMMQMLNFIAQAVAMGIYGKLVDVNARIHWNPLPTHPSSFIYSNLFFALAISMFLVWGFYYWHFIQRNKQSYLGNRI